MSSDKWQAVLISLQGSMTKNSFQTFAGSRAKLNNSGQLLVYPANKFSFEKLKNRFMPTLARSVEAVYGDGVTIALQENFIELEVEPEPEPEPPKTPILPKGFTPVVDSLAHEIGLIPSAIYGVVWRYCQMNSRTCYASQKTVSDKLGLRRETVNRNIKILLDGAYIRCLNEKETGKTKVYIVTNKVTIRAGLSIEAIVNGQV